MKKAIYWTLFVLALCLVVPSVLTVSVRMVGAVNRTEFLQEPTPRKVVASKAVEGNQSAKMLSYSMDHYENSQRDLTAAELNVAKNENDVRAFELGASIQYFQTKEVIKRSDVKTRDGRELRLEIGQTIRTYYETLRRFPGDSKLYLQGSVEPHTHDDHFVIEREAVSTVSLETRKIVWVKVEDDRKNHKLGTWEISLPPGMQTPELVIPSHRNANYNIDFQNQDLISWNVNRSGWRALPTENGPHFNGRTILQFMNSPRNTVSQIVTVAFEVT